ncbi:wax ester/triacylglycerol synthase domain-containing protein [Mycobacterium montefiorense]|uniref:diacylglycerol O-acyltransferase n=1 Tax=Mycobacterium montefiorense TaxID=154654 RepID=A0AA37PN79_9MYCO|nr:wax ester/triacylglycerol synthase domain-containing protein [Mycobacterium montefiorense]GBG36806.1 diacylglycerol O-acyltransferase [Mycobacterium montefiorense]GKU37711.1 diacylglycerol O-acyltransferase [Mycobacterium montefiorense]GKU42670.1 diacylglycerol O-acyltransferase [Mycobacterium montefiorense]GKU46455.1 diacylglycerol O-acyltransferase [Mycobacterium montefiorense]GKU50962.1 diacylglycerol O-acyltransferase [Mycobacterium montefiorense]
MGQLITAFDAGLRTAADSGRQASLATGAVAIIEGAVPDLGQLKSLLAERIQSIPRCRQVLRTHSLRGARQWIDDPGFDLTYHLRRVAVGRPGDEADLSGAIAHACERPLELDRPLWECWVIEGLKGKWAILMKVHHYLSEAVPAAHLLTRLCDGADSDIFANQAEPKQNSIQAQKRGWADALWHASAVAGTVTNTLADTAWSVARMSSNEPAVTRRRYGTVRVPLAAVDAVCAKFRVTTNDVALAAITEGFRAVLLHRGEQPRAGSLRTLENRYLPVEHDDPVRRLRIVHNSLNKPRPIKQSLNIAELATSFMPFTLCAKALQLTLSRLPQPGIVTLATNAAGPRHRLRLMDATVERLLPIPPTASQLSSGVAVLSYGDELIFGITAGYDAAPELGQLAAGIEREMAHLTALSQDSVLLFTKDRRKRRAPGAAPRVPPSHPWARARH